MDYKAVQIIESQAAEREDSDKNEIRRILAAASVDADIDLLAKKLLYDCDVTLNFHPDRFSNNGILKAFILTNFIFQPTFIRRLKIYSSVTI